MAKNKKNIELTEKEFDQLLGSFGYIFPRSDQELDNFREVYFNEEFKLRETKIDPNEIIQGTFKLEKKVIQLSTNINLNEIQSLQLAARKGERQISNEILKKLKEKHSKRDDSND